MQWLLAASLLSVLVRAAHLHQPDLYNFANQVVWNGLVERKMHGSFVEDDHLRSLAPPARAGVHRRCKWASTRPQGDL